MSRTAEREEAVEEEQGEEVEQEQHYEEIEKLQEMGINATDIKKLKEHGIHTVAGVLMHTKKQLMDIKGVTEKKVEQLVAAANRISDFSFISGTKMAEKRKQVVRISTGSQALDNLLGGGIETMSITEVFGQFRTGKTQLAHTLCVTAQLPYDMGGGNGKVIYIDTEGTFRPDRIEAIAERFEVDPAMVLDNLSYCRAYTHEHQIALLTLACARMIEERIALVVVDSATALFRVDFSGRGQLAERQIKLGQFLSQLTKMAEEFNTAVYITNQVVTECSGTTMGDPTRPIGGNIIAHASTTRLFLKKGRGEQRICKVYDSPCLPEEECLFQLSTGGVMDVKD